MFAESKHSGVACPWACACPLAPPAPAAPVTPVRSRTCTVAREDIRRSSFSSPAPPLPLNRRDPRSGAAPTRGAGSRGGEAEVWGPFPLFPSALSPGAGVKAPTRSPRKATVGLRITPLSSVESRDWGEWRRSYHSGRRPAGSQPARPGCPPRGREGCGSPVAAQRPETRPRGGGTGVAHAMSPVPQAGGDGALRLAPQPASAPDPLVTSSSAPAPLAALRVSAVLGWPRRRGRRQPAGIRPAARGSPRVGGGMCVYGGGSCVFLSAAGFLGMCLNQLFGRELRVPAAVLHAPVGTHGARGMGVRRSGATGGRGPGPMRADPASAANKVALCK